MIKPVNGHLLIEPVKHESFVASQRDTYEEVGVVIALPRMTINHRAETVDDGIPDELGADAPLVRIGDRVFFDSWLAAKYPKNETEYFWLVKWEDVRAIDQNEPKIPG